MIEQHLDTIMLLVGAVLGAALIRVGYKDGFRASYEIRKSRGDETEDGLLPASRDPAEFELAEEDDSN